MKKHITLISICLNVLFLTANADDTAYISPVIRSIQITGNNVTQPHVILREMMLQVGDTLVQTTLDKDRDHIYNLGLFNEVTITHTDSASVTDLLVTVVERWYIFPVPIVRLRTQGISTLSYGLGVSDQNFLGRNEKVSLSYSTGYDHTASFSYQNPRLTANDDIFLRTTFQYRDSHNLDNSDILFEQINRSASLSLGKRFGYYQTFIGTVGYQTWEIPDSSLGRTVSPDGTDRFLELGVQYTYDARNVREYPTDGWYLDFTAVNDGLGSESTIKTLTTTADFRWYTLMNQDFTIAWHGFGTLVTGGAVPMYHWLYLNNRTGIRGYIQRDYSGEDILGGSFEVRVPIVSPRFVTFNFLNIYQFNTMRFGIYAALFTDFGKIWYRSDHFDSVPWLASAGMGIHFLLPYSLVLRAELSMNAIGQLRIGVAGGVPF